MISGIFGKTKPVNFIILAIYLLIYLVLSRYLLSSTELSLSSVAWSVCNYGMLVFTLFLINFIDKKNNLSGNTTYSILLFSLWISFFPQLFDATYTIAVHIFVLLSIGTLLQLHHETAVKQKLFNASLWLCAASLLYPWAMLYFILVYAAIVFYAQRNYRNWLIPLIALITLLILHYTYFLWYGNDAGFLSHYRFTIRWKDISYSPENYFLPFVFLLFAGLGAIVAYGINVIRKRAKRRPAFLLFIAAFFIGTGTVLFLENEQETTVILMVFPVTVLMVNYIERIQKKRLREALLWLFLIAPAAMLVSRWMLAE